MIRYNYENEIIRFVQELCLEEDLSSLLSRHSVPTLKRANIYPDVIIRPTNPFFSINGKWRDFEKQRL